MNWSAAASGGMRTLARLGGELRITLVLRPAALIPTLAGNRASQHTLDQELSSRAWEN